MGQRDQTSPALGPQEEGGGLCPRSVPGLPRAAHSCNVTLDTLRAGNSAQLSRDRHSPSFPPDTPPQALWSEPGAPLATERLKLNPHKAYNFCKQWSFGSSQRELLSYSLLCTSVNNVPSHQVITETIPKMALRSL